MNAPRHLSPMLLSGNREAKLEHIAELLNTLQSEYTQICTSLTGMYHQLVHQSTQIDRQLGFVAALLEQLADLVQAVNLNMASDCGSTPEASFAQDPSVSTLRVYTFARFQLVYGERTFAFCSNKKGNAILHYLLIQPDHSAIKERLLELFWPDEPADKAGHKLHIAISALRQALNKELGITQLIEFEDERYYLNPAITVWLDADELVAHLGAGQQLERQGVVDEAIAQYEAGRALGRGDFLAEDLYADWAAALRARLEEAYLTLLGRLAACYLDQGRYEACIDCCRQIVDKDSFREDAYRQLMLCYVRMGLRNQALRVYQECAQTLQRELGVAPMRETVALYEWITQA